jgi:hypothetical protein
MAIRERAGTMAPGLLPKAAIPAGRLRTPTPTMALTRLKISLGMVAVPPDVSDEADDPPFPFGELVAAAPCLYVLTLPGRLTAAPPRSVAMDAREEVKVLLATVTAAQDARSVQTIPVFMLLL